MYTVQVIAKLTHCLKIKLTQCEKKIIFWFMFLNLFYSDMEFLDVLTEGLDRVLLVRGGGREVVTIYS